MNDDFNDPRLNRLIDGELSPTEYRAFLSALDDEPGGWRRCALALLESQALSDELIDLRRTLDSPANVSANNRIVLTHPAGVSPLSLLAIAASFFVAFALGIIAPRIFSARTKDATLAGNFNTRPTAMNENLPVNDVDARPRNIGNLQLV